MSKEEHRKVLAVLFHYITLLPNALSQPHHFTELRTMGQIGFNNTSKYPADFYAKSLSRTMNEEELKREHIVSHGILEWEFKKEDAQDIIDCLELRKARMMLAAKVFDGVDVPQEGEWMKERWYGTEYAKREFDPEELPVSHVTEHDGKGLTWIKVLSSEDIASLYLPGKNTFLPESLQVDRIDTTSVRDFDTLFLTVYGADGHIYSLLRDRVSSRKRHVLHSGIRRTISFGCLEVLSPSVLTTHYYVQVFPVSYKQCNSPLYSHYLQLTWP